MRLSAVLFSALVTLGCGARTGDDLFFHPDVDAAVDTFVPPPPTCPPSEPAAGATCSFALTCKYPGSKSCGEETAQCIGSAWVITRPGCSCPPVPPTPGSFCALVPSDAVCTYDNACGAKISATCRAASWSVSDPGCPTPCPATEPRTGDACGPTPTKCTWTSGCGGTDVGGCDGKRWTITAGACACPTSRPPLGSGCSTEGQKCSWTNLCKTTDTGVCTAGAWKIDLQPCGTCPLFTPADGARCTTSAGCKYYLGGDDFCSTQCACDGVRWSCGPC